MDSGSTAPNSAMIDPTGVEVGGIVREGCVDGPERQGPEHLELVRCI
jgi:hypothetical protein